MPFVDACEFVFLFVDSVCVSVCALVCHFVFFVCIVCIVCALCACCVCARVCGCVCLCV